MYCGAGTKRGKAIWLAYFALLVPCLLCWILYFVFGSRCGDKLEEQGVQQQLVCYMG